MILLSGFADEAALSKTIDQQFAAFAALGLKYYSIRFIDAGSGVKNVMQLSDAEIDNVLKAMDEYGLSVSSIGSPIGKVKLLDVDDGTQNAFIPFDQYLNETVGRAIELAKRFDCKLIRGFSFYHPRESDPRDHLDQAGDQLRQIVSACAANGLNFGLEVEANLIGQNADLLLEIVDRVQSDSMSLIFDGGNLVTQGYSTGEIKEQFLQMLPHLGWIHIKDYLHPGEVTRLTHVDEESLRHFVPASMGQSGHASILSALAARIDTVESRMKQLGFPGLFIDLEPHVRGGGQFGGFSGPDGFGVALRDFCRLLEAAGLPFQLRSYEDLG